MEISYVIEALAALAQETRLNVFRLLVRVGPNGLTAGEIARREAISPSTLSFHLGTLARAGLVTSWRRQRQIIYAVRVEGVRQLLSYLTEDCCQGKPDLCGGLSEMLQQGPCTMGVAMGSKAYNVLFLCTGNSARSILAECALRRFGGDRFVSHSAGSRPKGQVHPMTLKLLKNLNYSIDGLRSKDWAEFATPDSAPLDFVFTVCDNAAGEPCPIWPGQPMTAHWGVEDPAEASGSDEVVYKVFKRVYLELENRIKLFASLRLEGLDKLSLRNRLQSIGQTRLADSASAEAETSLETA